MEHKYRNELQHRTIEPSKDAWEKLAGRLTDFEKSKKQKKWTFLKYAASILILISVGIYFGQENEQTSEKEIVAEPVIKVQENKIQSIVEEPQNVIATSENEKSSVKSIQKKTIKNAIVNKQIHEAVALVNETNEAEKFQKSNSVTRAQVQFFGTDSLQQQKIEALVAKVQIIKMEKGEVSDFELDQLLEDAQKSLMAAQKVIHHKSFSGADLLAEAEYDLDKDLKERLFEAIVSTLKDTKNRFANRDN
jgi:hypothetical protein